MFRSIIREAHDYRNERVHFAVDPADGDPIPLYRCDRCKRPLPADQFKPVGAWRTFKCYGRFRRVFPMHPHCARCREQAKGKHCAHPLYTPKLDAYFANLVAGAKGGAKQRGLVFAVTKDDAIGLYLAQQGTCALTGLLMDDLDTGNTSRNGRNYKAPSIDRINSQGNYTLDNIQIVMRVVNIMKNDLPQDQFVALCRRIADHNISF